MSNVPSVPAYIQVEESRFRAPVSESVFQKFAGTNNYLLDHYPIPPGTIIDFAGPVANIPSGWLLCDGSAVSRTTYANLFTTISTLWGGGDGLTTFNIPDLRGYFTRMQNLGTGRDPDAGSRGALLPGGATGDSVGSYQASALQFHNHSVPTLGGGSVSSVAQGAVTNQNASGITTSTAGQSSETRPLNAYVLKLIKT